MGDIMDKQQAFYNFFNSFALSAYDENSVPDDAQMPYITYQVIIADLDDVVFPTASIWYRSDSWAQADAKVNEISQYIETMLPIPLKDGGFMHITKGTPFAQRMAETDTTVKRYLLNLGIEFLTEY